MQGSSPRMRGTLPFPSEASNRSRIIPAHAGNTLCPMAGSRRLRDHPRACGEHAVAPSLCEAGMGSSPRMRGTHVVYTHNLPPIGIIPAHAGNTSRGHSQRITAEDHPRACGEHALWHFQALSQAGSSPRMRGTPSDAPSRCCSARIIPAHAGNTSTLYVAPRLRRDHPRACGEHRMRQHGQALGAGSSPRMRGTHQVHG